MLGNHIPIGTRIGSESIIGQNFQFPSVHSQKSAHNGTKKPKEMTWGVNFIADSSGCGYYRMIWPENVINYDRSYSISSLQRMVLDQKGFYSGVKTVRIQRQVSDSQLQIAKYLRKICDVEDISLIYEIDDIPFIEDIPEWNQNRKSYENPSYQRNIKEIMNFCDEITVTNHFMKNYFSEKLKNQNITVVPNYVPKFWMDRFYDENQSKINFGKHKKKPRILYAGSGSHYGDGKLLDDLSELVPFIRKTYKQYQWVFLGGFPRLLEDLVKNGKIEWHQWVDLLEYPYEIARLKPNVMVAPLRDNNFNKSKSDIKYREACAMGIPIICQDLVSYKNARLKFRNTSELDDQIKAVTVDAGEYMKEVRKHRQNIHKFWLEDHREVWQELYKYRYGNKNRKLLIDIGNLS